MPDINNVYGTMRVRGGLKGALQAVRSMVGEKQASVRSSGYDGSQTLSFSDARCHFESTPLEERGEHLLNGSVAGTLAEITTFVSELSRELSNAGIDHLFEIYAEGGTLAKLIPAGEYFSQQNRP